MKVHLGKVELILRYTYTLLFGLFIFLHSSCSPIKKYVRPEVQVPESYRIQMESKSAAPIVQVTWRELFRDEQLQQYLNKALEQNFDLEKAYLNIQIAENYLLQSKAGYFPTVSIASTFSRTKNAKNSQFGRLFSEPIEQFQMSGALSWELDIWGKIRSGKRAAQAAYMQSIAAHQAIKTQLIAALSTSYFQLLAWDKQIEISKLTVSSRKSSLETMQALKIAGQVSEAAVKQSEAQIYSTEILTYELKRNIQTLENAFCLLLGETPHPVIRGEFDSKNSIPEFPLDLPSQLLANRPDVLEAEYGLVKAFELENVARSNLYPSLNLNLNGGLQSLQAETWFSSGSLFSQIISGLTQPILNGRRNRTQLKVAELQKEQAYLDYKKSLLNSFREVNDALFSLQSFNEIATARKKELEANVLAAEYSEALLINGQANYLELLNARQNVLLSQLRLIDAKFGSISASIELFKALGGARTPQ
ncbi:efflux transporter outer membrane subunit [Robiginitalea sp.]|nr:efflux transporter outer membrane subunit [Robiginitalea sp.]